MIHGIKAMFSVTKLRFYVYISNYLARILLPLQLECMKEL